MVGEGSFESKRDRVAAVSKENMLQDVFTRKLNGLVDA